MRKYEIGRKKTPEHGEKKMSFYVIHCCVYKIYSAHGFDAQAKEVILINKVLM